jgi:hypothetical protein
VLELQARTEYSLSLKIRAESGEGGTRGDRRKADERARDYAACLGCIRVICTFSAPT